jgi:uncharacterized protein YndB with AHSA1/START domain
MDTSYELIDERPALRLERRIAHPVGAVWAALTDREELAGWFPSTIAGELRAGSRLEFSFPEHDDVPDMDGEVTDFDPPRLLAFDWGEDHLRFELAPADEGARTDLRLTVLLGTEDKAARDGAGWTVCLARLEAMLDGAGEAEIKQISSGWREHYDEYARRGFPATAPIPQAARRDAAV